jgi:hypothetical protein
MKPSTTPVKAAGGVLLPARDGRRQLVRVLGHADLIEQRHGDPGTGAWAL